MDSINSVLNSIKKMLGMTEDYKAFDADVIIHINTVLMNLSQMGVVSPESNITGENETWDDIVDNVDELSGIKSYVYLKVRLLFDPPASSAMQTAMDNSIKELEWRMYTMRDSIGKAQN